MQLLVILMQLLVQLWSVHAAHGTAVTPAVKAGWRLGGGWVEAGWRLGGGLG